MTSELAVVDWYIELFEQGRNVKNLLKDFIDAQGQIKTLKETLARTQHKLEKKLSSKRKKFKETLEQLVKIQNKVVKPLLEEVRKKEELNKRLLKQQAVNAKDLRMLYSVIRTPRLCDEYHKALRRKHAKQELSGYEKDCYHFIKDQMKDFKSETAFLDDFAIKIDRVFLADSVQPIEEDEEEPEVRKEADNDARVKDLVQFQSDSSSLSPQ